MFSLFAQKRKADAKRAEKEGGYRLPKNAVPFHYTVCFKPAFRELSFEASVAIDTTLTENSKQICLNAIELPMSKVIWEEHETQNRQEPLDMKGMERGLFTFNFDPFLIAQAGQLRINFKGPINDKKMSGLFRLKSFCGENEFNFIGLFEPADARRTMPCWDEPTFKSSFDVCLIVPKGKTVVGNMPIKARYNHKKNPKLEILEFKRTPKMSTHGLGFAIGSFESIEGLSTDEEVTVSVYTTMKKKEQGRFALTIASRAVSFLSLYLGCPFPVQKLDIIAIPEFSASPKSCWGLIMFQENQLLRSDESLAAAGDKLYISLLICQELAKQWFGNLVTFSWWNHLCWLREGMAIFLRYVCMEEVRDEYESSTHFIIDVVQRGMRGDALKSTLALEISVNSPSDCEEIFDETYFRKGAALIRMLYNFVGEDHFKYGLNRYLFKYRFNNATAQDLWKCFDEVSNKPVTQLMTSWSTQKGFPLIKVAGKHDGKNRYLKVTQEKFSLDPTGRDVRAEGIWLIPFTVTSEKDPTSVIFHTLIDSKSSTIVIPDSGKSEWVKINPGVVGFYRVKYSPDLFSMLVHAIRDKQMEPVDRLNVLDDQFALLLSGIGTTIEFLTLSEAYIEEDDCNVWFTISYVFDKLLKVFAYINLDDSVRHFGRYIFGRILERVGYKSIPNEHHQTKLLRNMVLRMMVKFKHYEVINKCKSVYDDFLRNEESIPRDFRYVVYNAMLSKNDEDVLKSFTKMYRESNSTGEKDRVINAFGAVTDSGMIRYVLDFSLSDEVRRNDTVYMLIALSKNKIGREMAWTFFKDNFATFKNRYGIQFASKLIKGIVEDFASDEKAIEVAEFFKMNPMPGTEKAMQLAIENIRVNEAWLKREKNISALQDYLEADAL